MGRGLALPGRLQIRDYHLDFRITCRAGSIYGQCGTISEPISRCPGRLICFSITKVVRGPTFVAPLIIAGQTGHQFLRVRRVWQWSWKRTGGRDGSGVEETEHGGSADDPQT